MKRILSAGALVIVAIAIGAYLFKKPDPTSGGLTVVSNLQAGKAKPNLVSAASKTAAQDMPVPSKKGPWPRVMAKSVTFPFGRMQVREKKTHEFVLVNEGEADLLLGAGNTTCKCTQFGFAGSSEKSEKSAVVKPGASVTLVMSWKAGEVPDRQFRHGGDVYTNDPKNPVLKYAVHGAIEMPFEMLPQVWGVGNVYSEQPGKMTATLGSKVHEKLEIISITSPSGKVIVTPTPMTLEMKSEGYVSGYVLNVEVASDIPAGLFQEEVQIKLAQTEESLKVMVTARKQGVLQLQQMAGSLFDRDSLQLQLGSFPASQGREAKMLLIVDEKEMSEPFQITESQTDPSFVSASISPLGEPSGSVHRYILTITVPAGRPHVQKTSSTPGYIRLATNHTSGEGINLGLLMYSN